MTGAAANVQQVIELRPIDRANFRDALGLEVLEWQTAWVAPTARYLAICAFDGVWRPLGLYADGIMVGFAMWTTDPADSSHWIGGFVIDKHQQRRGLGHAAMAALIAFLRDEQGAHEIALSYAPDNEPARRLYAGFGFRESGELEGTEKVARLDVTTAASPA